MTSVPPGLGCTAAAAPDAVGFAPLTADVAATEAAGLVAAAAAVVPVLAVAAVVGPGTVAAAAAALGAVVAATGFGVSVAVLPPPQAARIAAAALAPAVARNARRVTRYNDRPAGIFLMYLSLDRRRTYEGTRPATG
jgi:hypothetical protein